MAARPTDDTFAPGHYYPLHEFARRCGMTVRAVRERFIQTGELRVSKLARGSEIIPYHEAARFFEERLCDVDNDAKE